MCMLFRFVAVSEWKPLKSHCDVAEAASQYGMQCGVAVHLSG